MNPNQICEDMNQSGGGNGKRVKCLTNGSERAPRLASRRRDGRTDRQRTKSEELWQMTNRAGNGRKKKGEATIISDASPMTRVAYL